VAVETGTAEHLRTVRTWSGADGFARFRQTGDWSVPDPREFRADWRAVTIDGVQLGEWRSTPVAGSGMEAEAGAIRLDAVVGGRVQYRLDGVVQQGDPGSVHLMHMGHSVRIAAQVPIRIARITLFEEAMPVWLRDATPLPDGPLPTTALTTGFVALLDRLTAAVRDDPDEPPLTTAKAIGVLALALLEEAIPSGASGPGDLRDRIVGYIDRHLGDNDLGPKRIADEFDISLRWVHRVFNQGDESIARYIRERRVDAIAHQLRTEKRWVRVGDLAFRFGFAGRDQLTRAFKQRYGMTVNDYLELAMQGSPLPPPSRG